MQQTTNDETITGAINTAGRIAMASLNISGQSSATTILGVAALLVANMARANPGSIEICLQAVRDGAELILRDIAAEQAQTVIIGTDAGSADADP